MEKNLQDPSSVPSPLVLDDDPENVRIQTRREFCNSLSRRGLTPTQILPLCTKLGLLAGITDALQTIRKDLRFGRRVARRLRSIGNVEAAEAEYIARLEELYKMACADRNHAAARVVLQDWAYAHGIKPAEPSSGITSVKVTKFEQEIEGAATGELRAKLRGISIEVQRLVGAGGADQDPPVPA